MASQRQPATRQRFRLPSIARPVIPATETPEPRGPVPRTTFRPMGQAPAGVSSVPTSPIKRTSVPSSPVQAPRTSPTPTTTSSVPSLPKPQVSAPSASLSSSPSPKPVPSPPKPSISSMPTSPPKPLPTSPPKPVPTSPPKPVPTVVALTRLPSPIPFSRMLKPAVQTPPQSPKTKPTAPPPSPLILPSPQLNSKAELEPKIPAETEQKTVLVQTTSEKPKTWLNGTGHHNDFDQGHKHSIGHHGKHEESEDVFGKKEKGHRKKFSSDSDEGSMRVITIAGENKGSFMEVIKSPLKHSFDGNSHTLQHKGSSKTETGWNSSSSEEGNSKMKDKSNKEKVLHSPPMGAYMNSNVQGINNSIVFNSSSSHHDPGVHLSLSRKPYGHGIHVKDTTKGHN